EGEAELQEFARRPGRKWLLIERDDLARLERPLPLVEVARDRNPRDGYFLMTDPAGREASSGAGAPASPERRR
ncbi:MAG TPA: hypothetical protein VM599_02260, partial [Thermoanaerobaculia bacterium]|nr:hypothetical protein [Thermoanaerobaculia bacterium]